jgi:hypothetical protein
MKKALPALIAGFMSVIGAVSAAHSKTIDFAVVAIGGTLTYSGPTLDKSVAFDFDGAALTVSQVGPQDNSGLAPMNTLSLIPTDIMYGSGTGPGPLGADIVKTWTDALGTFKETLTTVVSIDRHALNAITVTLRGTTSGPGFLDTPTDLILGATQAGGPGSVISASFTNTTFGATVPETSTWMMMGLGFVGLGYAAVRRSSKDRSAIAL